MRRICPGFFGTIISGLVLSVALFLGSCERFFEPDQVAEQGLFRPDFLQELARKPLNDQYYRRQFWSVAALGLWQRRFDVWS